MPSTLVIQSHRTPLPFNWLERCLESVRQWSSNNRFEYQFLDDQLFSVLPDDLQEKLSDKKVVASDLARLITLRNALNNGIETVVWLDADFLIIEPDKFTLPDEPYAVGREVWVQPDEKDRFKTFKKVHNAFLMFRQGNSFLEFYIETAERLLRQNTGGIPPQFIGPKLLSALHNIAQLPVLESAALLSPSVIKAINGGGGEALELFNQQSLAKMAGANLCTSSCEKGELTSSEIEHVINVLSNKSESLPVNC